MEKIEGTSIDITKENIERLKELFPNCVREGKIDFDVLQTILGEDIDTGREKYQFSWNGKTAAIKLAQTPSSSTLRPCKAKSKDWNTTKNFYVEGDNLEVLKQLQKTYFGKIKLIYIDPPYNTGGDFVYKDNFINSIGNYKEQTNQNVKSNPETSGRYHTDWLNMMYPRLILARNLLADDGTIFISIDDYEQENLKKIAGEIFGESNFVAQLIWERAYSPKNDAKYVSNSHDYVLIYAKSIEKFKIGRLPRTEEANERYKNPDNDPRGVWKPGDLSVKTYNSEYDYPIKLPSGRIVSPPLGRCWRQSKEAFDKNVKDNRIWFGPNGDSVPQVKRFLTELKYEGMAPTSIMFYKDVGHSQEGAKELKELMDAGVFDGPKPIRLLNRIITLSNLSNDDIVLDFFSGSGSTAHACMEYELNNDINIRWIMVQLPEKTDVTGTAYQSGYSNICEIGEERIRRAGEKIKQEWKESNQEEGLFADETKEFPVDIGFKVFKLDSTNINPWDNEQVIDDDNLFDAMADVFKPDRTNEDILYEIMLKYGVFDMPVTEIELNGKKMYKVGSRYMLVCLEETVTEEDVKAIGGEKPRVVVFNESGFSNDNDKINAVYNLEKAGIEDIKCI